MRHIYIISGYGVPKDIFKDGNAQLHLRLSFNAIYRDFVEKRVKQPVIVLTSGRTDMFKPYRRTEAGEMAKVFRGLMTKGEAKRITKTWKLVLEQKAISSLENLQFSLAMLKKRGIRSGRVTIFMEYTRRRFVMRLARRVFPKAFRVSAAANDFDVSANRYFAPAYLEKKNERSSRYDLWALRSAKNLAEHHRVYAQRLAYLRKAGTKQHIEAVKTWWDSELAKAIGKWS